mmetsp:Transcript_16526/g.33772  ORF Transcript_16526/g.33772 Transcript_16526/m.33772 type:complete len:503 (-) Transcript_16526:248-1756(-)|eukprot:CAMPEP_0184687616 /NCGR_PEP_ID=MMETSP0312-20130426/27152_1 /TAXON_ID=31354 /ORGANISM="Compsopogon coeruleus, Strain SAG 36.94" /LENGTH=502 /DNA_ID=CAMNT_0027143979 /DNA_START=316 /DNA_END=1824 /DNA_ORIENTATION=+
MQTPWSVVSGPWGFRRLQTSFVFGKVASQLLSTGLFHTTTTGSIRRRRRCPVDDRGGTQAKALHVANERNENHAEDVQCRAAYIHIPFCRSRCYYCDFPLQAVGDGAIRETLSDGLSTRFRQYTDSLLREIDVTAEHTFYKKQGMREDHALDSVYFGGGTPSLMPSQELERILRKLDQHFGLSRTVEITVEMDPGTFEIRKAREFVSLGMTRASVGAQSFEPELLRLCGRRHSVDDIYDAVGVLRSAGVENLSIDLISGLPNQTLDHWLHSLSELVRLEPKHASCYDLVIEEGTRFGRMYYPGTDPLPTTDLAAEMYRMAVSVLQSAGYSHYEVSNYAKGEGFKSRHNETYWDNRPYLGFGMGATSYLAGRTRVARPRTMAAYIAWVEELERSRAQVLQKIPSSEEAFSEQLEDTLMLGLRRSQGLAIQKLQKLFGKDVTDRVIEALQPFCELGLVFIDPTRISMSDPDGFLVQNTILSSLLNSVVWEPQSHHQRPRQGEEN